MLRHVGVSTPSTGRRTDSAERFALVAYRKRKALLRAGRHRLRYEELEECFGQSVMEIVRWLRAGGAFDSPVHAAAALETRFRSRVFDRHRALAGRSGQQQALAQARGMGDNAQLPDPGCGVEELVMQRLELRNVSHVAPRLTDDQRLLVACHVGLQMRPREFCALFGWSPEKYRKVSSRARASLRALTDEFAEYELNAPAEERGGGQRDRDAPVQTPPPSHGRVPGSRAARGGL